jgi:hypothetical protein
MRIADDRGAISSLDLVLHRVGNPMYLRDNHEEARALFRTLGQELSIHIGQIDRRYFFVNSPTVISKLQNLFSLHNSIVLNAECKIISDGLCVLDAKFHSNNEESPESIFKSWLNRIGATPSLYQVMNHIHSSDSTLNQSCDNTKLLERLLDPNLTSKLLHKYTDHSTYHLRKSAYLLTKGIIDLKHNIIRTNSMIQEALSHLLQVLWGMSYFHSNLLRCTRLFELVSDDLFTILTIAHPYTNLQHILCNTYRTRYPSLAKWIQSSYLTAGGMDAMSTALYAAKGRVVRIEPSHDYLEMAYLVEDGNKESESIVYVANLNASVPRTRIDPVQLAKLIKSVIFPPFFSRFQDRFFSLCNSCT